MPSMPRPRISSSGHTEKVIEDIIHKVGDSLDNSPVPEEEAQAKLQEQLDAFVKASGLRRNKGGDVSKIIATLCASMSLLAICFISFSILRKQFPQVYANNVLSVEQGGYGTAPSEPSESFFGWLSAALFTEYADTEQCSGTDTALCLVFIEFAMRLMAYVGLPLLAVLGPLHFFMGNISLSTEHGHEPDWIGSISLNNIEPGSKIVWVHCLVVWYVCLVTETLVFRTMGDFMPVRFKWLKQLRPPRSTTLMVENIPEEFCSNDELKEFFSRLFPSESATFDIVESAYVCKHTKKLERLFLTYESSEMELQKVRHDSEANGDSAELGEREKQLVATLDSIALDVQAEQERIQAAASLPRVEARDILHGHTVMALDPEARKVTASSGFVTFTCERITLMVLNMRCYADADKFIMSIPPPPSDIIYNDLKTNPKQQVVLDIIGYAFIGLVFYMFIPTIICLAGVIQIVCNAFPMIEDNLGGVVATLPLQIILSFLPTVLFLIFNSCFSLKAVAWGQKLLQTVFFVFNVIFTLLITAVIGALANYPGGQDDALLDMVRHPEKIPGLLAESLPSFTHYYLDFMLVRWTTHALELTRYITLMKYIVFRKMYGEEMAVDLAEPEDQDFYGIGARCTRFALDLLVGIVFSSISPLISVLVFINAAISRTCFGYLMIFAETKKHDMGGTFFVSMLHHVQFGLLVYISLMMGVIAKWSGDEGKWPLMIAGSTFFYLAVAYFRFCKKYQWEQLPFDEVCKKAAMQEADEQFQEYLQLGEKKPIYRQYELIESLVGRHHVQHNKTEDAERQVTMARSISMYRRRSSN